MEISAPCIHVVIDSADEASSVLRAIGPLEPGSSWLVQFMTAPEPEQVNLLLRHLETLGAQNAAIVLPTSAQFLRFAISADFRVQAFPERQRAFSWLLSLREREMTQ